MIRMAEEDLNALRAAVATLEHPALAARLGNIAGKPIELVGRALPAAASGAVGGGFGLAALPVELPISTIIMLRSIGDIARSEGEDLADPESALACLQVFALGSAMARRMPQRAGTSPLAGCSPNRSRRPRASSPNAAWLRKARRSWSGLLRKSHPALAWW